MLDLQIGAERVGARFWGRRERAVNLHTISARDVCAHLA